MVKEPKQIMKAYWDNLKSQERELFRCRDKRNSLYDKTVFEILIPQLLSSWNYQKFKEDNFTLPEPFGEYEDGSNYYEMFQVLSISYLIKLKDGKFKGKDYGYIKNSLRNVRREYFRNRFFTQDIFERMFKVKIINGIGQEEEEEKIALDDYKSAALYGPKFFSDNYSENSDGNSDFIGKSDIRLASHYDFLQEAERDQKEKTELNEWNLFPTTEMVSINDRRKEVHYRVNPTERGFNYHFIGIKDKIIPDFPPDYQNKIFINGKKVNVKKLFRTYLERLYPHIVSSWDNYVGLSYESIKLNFCNQYKYNGWKNLNVYVFDFIKETGIEGEYYFFNQIKWTINKINSIAEELWGKYGSLKPREYCTQSNICKAIGLPQNHPKVCRYLENLVYRREILYNEDTNTYYVKK